MSGIRRPVVIIKPSNPGIVENIGVWAGETPWNLSAFYRVDPVDQRVGSGWGVENLQPTTIPEWVTVVTADNWYTATFIEPPPEPEPEPQPEE